MKIALSGYGKMGKTIERIAKERGHEIVDRITEGMDRHDLSQADVVIDFSVPEAAYENVINGFRQGVPVVCGTTGWLDRYEDAATICKETGSAFIYASNFSLGVNLFFELNQHLARMMKKFHQYRVSIEEIHHTQKLDAPSGTAISLANQIIEEGNFKKWKLGEAAEDELPIVAKREENIPGTHTVSYDSDIDRIEIRHSAHSRDGFAMGAVIAAEWLKGRQGVFTMKDVLFLQERRIDI